MPDNDIASTTASAIENAITKYGVDSAITDAGTGYTEYEYVMADWEKYYGYYLSIPELQSAIDTKATWVLGAGFEADETTKMFLTIIEGSGKDTFNSFLLNMYRVMLIAGDSYAEVIRDKDGILANLKPLDPSSIKIIYDKKGRIKRYEQITKNHKESTKFKPEEIFHLSRLRIADQVHGTSIIPSVEWIILARNEAMSDWAKVLRRNVKPMRIWYLDSDDQTKINEFKATTDSAHANTENLYVPKGTVETEIATVAPNQTLNPTTWINDLKNFFFQAVQLPQILVGNSQEFTDASAKIAYLAFEQNVKGEQLYVEEQVLGQLNLDIQLTFPASLQNDVISGDAKNTPITQGATPDDTTVELEGRS